MQTQFEQGATHHGGMSKQSRTIAMIAIVLFALSGLISGFAFGAFGHSNTPTTRLNPDTSGQHVQNAGKTPTPKTTRQTEQPVFLGEPQINTLTYAEVADGNTPYTISAKIANKNTGTPITATDVTCKIWLTKDNHASDMLKANEYTIPKTISSIQQPFPDEVPNGLTFTSTQQTQTCNSAGDTTWNYTVSPSVDKGTYYIVVLADWKGVHYNWRIAAIHIRN